MSLNMGDQEYNSGKKYRQKGTFCGPNTFHIWLATSRFGKVPPIYIFYFLDTVRPWVFQGCHMSPIDWAMWNLLIFPPEC
jgi:hypothetical protein